MDDVIDAIKERIKSPLLGYSLIALVYLNWQPIYYVIFGEETTLVKFAYFDEQTDIWSTLCLPLLYGSLFTVTYPWVRYAVGYLIKKPSYMQHELQLNAEHQILSKRQQLESARKRVLTTVETDLISRAKRDEEISQIENDQTRKKLESEIANLRKKLDSKGSRNEDKASADELMDFANQFRDRADKANNELEKLNFIDKATHYEAMAQAAMSRRT